jgi:predicted RNA polymerase sigma factor
VPGADAATVERAYRESSGRAVATLARVFGDIDIAEDAVQEAFAVAAQRWPATGVDPHPRRWTACGGSRPAPAAMLRRPCCRPVPMRRRWNRCPMTACG